ncbi:hypothetical protein [Sphingomicrobium aestuariivivum]|uniref:hypothetical protein n=1 Tax=Sphingomicrobium aestuariivivum TaxID=1582356 RepID=UPI001FD6A70C|nr:hypothetical protein [Sphingomicrobium aestuariivivum]MCJ8190616.1 hypothetical protein [Sphingomicrobium aestuariivivum]
MSTDGWLLVGLAGLMLGGCDLVDDNPDELLRTAVAQRCEALAQRDGGPTSRVGPLCDCTARNVALEVESLDAVDEALVQDMLRACIADNDLNADQMVDRVIGRGG